MMHQRAAYRLAQILVHSIELIIKKDLQSLNINAAAYSVHHQRPYTDNVIRSLAYTMTVGCNFEIGFFFRMLFPSRYFCSSHSPGGAVSHRENCYYHISTRWVIFPPNSQKLKSSRFATYLYRIFLGSNYSFLPEIIYLKNPPLNFTPGNWWHGLRYPSLRLRWTTGQFSKICGPLVTL